MTAFLLKEASRWPVYRRQVFIRPNAPEAKGKSREVSDRHSKGVTHGW